MDSAGIEFFWFDNKLNFTFKLIIIHLQVVNKYDLELHG